MIHTQLVTPVAQLLHDQAARHGKKPAFIDASRSVSYRELDERTARLGGHFAAMASGRGARGLIVAGNGVEVAESYLGLVRASMVAVCINPNAAGPEIAYQLDHCGAELIITDTQLLPVIEDLLSDGRSHISVVVIGEPVDGPLNYESLATTTPDTPAPDDLSLDETAFLLYTSGTTGRPKGVMLTQRSMLWMVAVCWSPMLGLGADDTLLSPLPLFHSYALDLCVLGVVATGATVHIMDRFSTDEVLDHLRAGGCTMLAGVPTMFQYLLHGTSDDETFPDLRRCVSAGAILPGPANDAFEERFGVELLDGYGITETSTMVAMNWPNSSRVAGSCGFAVTGVGVRVVDPATGVDVDPDIDGEVWVSGPGLMQGYFENPEATAEVLHNGWYRTGDLARRDTNGFLTISGRTKEMIIRGGENIYPAEVEEAVMHSPGVADAAVVAMPHDDLGEVPVVFVVPAQGSSVDPAAVKQAVRERLASFKVPAHVFTTDVIPRTGSGKTKRFQLQQDIPKQL